MKINFPGNRQEELSTNINCVQSEVLKKLTVKSVTIAVGSSMTFRRNVLPTPSRLNSKTSNQQEGTSDSILKMETGCHSETSANLYKSIIFWDITSCSPLSVNRRFGGTYRFHLQGRKISSARNQRASRWLGLAFFFVDDYRLVKKLPGTYRTRHYLTLKSTIFWDTTPCSPLKVNRRF
jgi:hypothetical protein